MKRRSKRLLKRQNDEENSSQAIDIPLDITIDILSRLPLKSLARFQCVSKLWSCLIIDTIKTRPPNLLVIFLCHSVKFPYRPTSHLHSCTYALNKNNTNTTTLISADKDSRGLIDGLSCGLTYRYVRGLVCCNSRIDQFAVFNPTTKQSLWLPRVGHADHFMDGLFGYDQVENQYKVLCFVLGHIQVFTLPSTEKQQWRDLGKSQDNLAPCHYPISNVCMNGIIYYVGWKNYVGVVVVMFDVRFERFDCMEVPMILRDRISTSQLVNYQGKLGFISHRSGDKNASMWIIEDDTGKKEWSKISLFIPYFLLDKLDYTICGATRNGEIVITPWRLKPAESYELYAYFYDPKQKQTRRIGLESTLQKEVYVYCEPDHIENTMPLVLPTCNSKKKPARALLKKKLLAIAFFCTALVWLVSVATRGVHVEVRYHLILSSSVFCLVNIAFFGLLMARFQILSHNCLRD